MARFSFDAVAAHIRKQHPACPDFAVDFFAAEVAVKTWTNASIGKAVGIVMQTYLRHNLTDYDALLQAGVDRLEARARVQPRVNAMIRSWRRRRSPMAPSRGRIGPEETGDEHGC